MAVKFLDEQDFSAQLGGELDSGFMSVDCVWWAVFFSELPK